jgi:hypothetical protein
MTTKALLATEQGFGRTKEDTQGQDVSTYVFFSLLFILLLTIYYLQTYMQLTILQTGTGKPFLRVHALPRQNHVTQNLLALHGTQQTIGMKRFGSNGDHEV